MDGFGHWTKIIILRWTDFWRWPVHGGRSTSLTDSDNGPFKYKNWWRWTAGRWTPDGLPRFSYFILFSAQLLYCNIKLFPLLLKGFCQKFWFKTILWNTFQQFILTFKLMKIEMRVKLIIFFLTSMSSAVKVSKENDDIENHGNFDSMRFSDFKS